MNQRWATVANPPQWCGGLRLRAVRFACLGVGFAFLGPLALRAADSSAPFLAALREAGWDDTAVAYLDWVESSPLLTSEFRAQIPYERAMSLAAQGRKSRNRDERSRLLIQAAESFGKFASGGSESPAAANALWQESNLRAELALTTLAQADSASGAARGAARTTALEHFDQASAAARKLLEICKVQLAKLPKPTAAMADPKIRAERDELVNRQVEAEYLLALMTFERAGAYDDAAPERAEALDDAWNKFGALVEQYREKLVGASSRFYQGRCAQEQGDYAKALGCYEDLIEKPTAQEVFRRWTARAHRRRAECLIAQEKYDEAIRGCEQWLADSRPAEREQAEWLEVAYQLAVASETQLKELPEGQSAGRRLENQVRDLFRTVAERPNDFQQDARLALASFARSTPGRSDYDTFDEALASGKDAWELMTSSLMAAKVAQENNPEGIAELQRDAAANKAEAQRAFAAALDLADPKSSIAELNSARYYLAWLYWEAGRLEEAAVLGEFLATRYSDGEYGPGAAKIALAAWEKLYQQARAGGAAGDAARGAFAASKLEEIAQLIATRWPDAPETASAVNILISIALHEKRVEEAQTLLAKLPAGSRAGAELSLGSALWEQYLAAVEDKGSDAQFDNATVALRQQSRNLLTSGFASVRKQPASSTSAAVGALYLVQLLLTENDWQAALDALEDQYAGPLAVIKAGSEAAERPKFVLETYKVALRTYLSAQPPQREQAKAMMEALDAFVAKQGGDDVADQLTRVYVAVGLQLQRQIKDLTAAGNHMDAQQAAAAFGDVLDRVAARPSAGDWSVRNWLAQTNLEIGLGLKGEEATRYLKRARDSYQAIIAAAEKREPGAPQGDTILGLRKRLGECLVALGDYQYGVEQYAKFLADRQQRNLDVQVAAANALLIWGAKGRSLEALEQSVQGTRPDDKGQNLIWGWNRLSRAADGARAQAALASDPAKKAEAQRFEDLFFEARYNIARARYFGGVIAATPEARKNQLEAARQHIAQMKSLYPELGGPKWKAAFDALLAQITAELKKE